MNDDTDDKSLIKRSIEEKIASLMAIIDGTAIVKNAQELLDTEKRIAAITDEIAGCVVKTVVARSVADDTLIADANALVKQSPVRMKKRGMRPVQIQPYRGDPFTVNAAYYARAGQSAKKADKKGGSTQS
jgi:hypothetical protein